MKEMTREKKWWELPLDEEKGVVGA